LPKERLEILRKAYKAALEDPELLAEAKKAKLVIDYVSPEEINKTVDETLSMAPEVKESLQFLVRKSKRK
jgi:tripartite-type tricarboxylate transporter receptor subunit TctC